jgi:hypothetical protein
MPRSKDEIQIELQEQAQIHGFDTVSEQIRSLRKDLHNTLIQMGELSKELGNKAKRSSLNDAAGYVLFANAHLRLVNAMHQGVQRTMSTDKILARGRVEREQDQKREQEKKIAKEMKDPKPLIKLPPKDEAFEELFGALLKGDE